MCSKWRCYSNKNEITIKTGAGGPELRVCGPTGARAGAGAGRNSDFVLKCAGLCIEIFGFRTKDVRFLYCKCWILQEPEPEADAMVILGFTSFEEPFKWAETFTNIPNYVDTDNTAVKHLLQNDPSQVRIQKTNFTFF